MLGPFAKPGEIMHGAVHQVPTAHMTGCDSVAAGDTVDIHLGEMAKLDKIMEGGH
jgi:hypothetical protein